MKNCHNCNKEWDDEYAGTCDGCGASVGPGFKSSNLATATPEEMDAQLRRSSVKAQRDQGIENAMRNSRGNAPEGMQVPETTVEVAKGFSGDIASEIMEAFKR